MLERIAVLEKVAVSICESSMTHREGFEGRPIISEGHDPSEMALATGSAANSLLSSVMEWLGLDCQVALRLWTSSQPWSDCCKHKQMLWLRKLRQLLCGISRRYIPCYTD